MIVCDRCNKKSRERKYPYVRIRKMSIIEPPWFAPNKKQDVSEIERVLCVKCSAELEKFMEESK